MRKDAIVLFVFLLFYITIITMPRRCALGCPRNTRGLLHVFPNPDKYPEQHKAWVRIVTGDQDHQNFDYTRHRVCDRHFTDRDRTRSSRLNVLAIPSLFLPQAAIIPGGSLQTQDPMDIEDPSNIEHQTITHLGSIQSSARSPRPECSFGYSYEPMEIENSLNIENQIAIGLTPPVDRICLEHNYCVSAKSQNSKRLRALRTSSLRTATKKTKILQENVKNLRRTIYRLRKKGHTFKARLGNAEMVNEVMEKMNTPAKIFCMMQYKQTQKKKKGRRFSMDEKVLSLSLYKKSPKCYALLSKLFTLPSAKCLKRMLSRVSISPGIDNEILFKNLEKQVAEMSVENRLCSLIFDEMSITPQLHFDAVKDEIKGLVSHGKKNIANHALVFMVKGLRKPFKQPVAYYFTNSINKIDLKKIVIEVITKINATGLTVVCSVCDQSTTNVSAINDLVNDAKSNILRKGKQMKNDYFVVNSKKIIPLYDTPHLIKGLRNNLINKNLKYFDFKENKEKIIKWEFFQQLYWADKSFGELRCLQKITEEHIDPQKMKKMRVKTATQLFSHSVAVATEHLSARGLIPEDCRNVINFVLCIDNLFDSLNVSSFKESNGKIFTAAVRKNSPHHELWQNSLKLLKSIRFIKDTTESVPPSVKNLIKTIEGFQALWEILSGKYSFDCMLTRNMNQDPIENFFGNIRSYGARNVAPNCVAFEGAYKSLILNNYNSPQSKYANCENDYNTCLQNLNFFFNNELESSNITEETDIPLRENILNDVEDMEEDNGQRSYVCGWVLKKCLTKIIKQCKECRDDVICKNDDEKNDFVKAKEYYPNKKWLCYPSSTLRKCFQEIQNICVSHLKRDVPNCGIKRQIKFYVNIFVTFPFKCETHKDQLINFFIDSTLNILIYSWCRNINRILCGKITNVDVVDELKVMAQLYYDKHKHLKTPK